MQLAQGCPKDAKMSPLEWHSEQQNVCVVNAFYEVGAILVMLGLRLTTAYHHRSF